MPRPMQQSIIDILQYLRRTSIAIVSLRPFDLLGGIGKVLKEQRI